MSKECYLEFVNRSFKSITVKVQVNSQDEWDDKKGKKPDAYFNNKKINFFDWNEMYMKHNYGYFRFTIKVEYENDKNSEAVYLPSEDNFFHMEEGLSSTTKRDRYYFKDYGFFVLVSRGNNLRRIGDENTDYGNSKGIFKVEVFSCSKRRLGIISDLHLFKYETDVLCKKFTDQIVKIQNRPELIAICGDLTANSRGNEKKLIDKFIENLEARNFPVCEGFGNHDVQQYTTASDIVKYVEKRTRQSDNKLEGYLISNSKLHYQWQVQLATANYIVNVHCIMLNNVPGKGTIECSDVITKKEVDEDKNIKYVAVSRSKKDMKEGIYERNPYDSLSFLYPLLNNYKLINEKYKADKMKIREVALLFFHINYNSESLEEAVPERWWPYDSRNDFIKTLRDNKGCEVITSFFGHAHSSTTSKETLTSIDSGEEIKGPVGIRVATGLNYTSFADVALIEKDTDCTLEIKVNYTQTTDITQQDNFIVNKTITISRKFNDL